MAKVALLIGVSDYGPGFNWLPGVGKDLVAIQRVLQHPEMGGFTEVEVLKNPDPLTMQMAIATLFNAQTRQPDDLVLLYFSGHYVSDRYDRFYFPTRLTCKNPNGELVAPTAIPAHLVKNIMNDSPAEQQVVILDCCNDNSRGLDGWTQNPITGNLQQQLGGIGRVILTAGNTATESSHKGFELSTYTHYLVEGIETGAADLDRDRVISVAEIHQYIRRRIGETFTDLVPAIYASDDPQQIYLAKAIGRRTALWWLENATSNTAIATNSKSIDNNNKDINSKGTDWEIDHQSTVAVLTSEMQEKIADNYNIQRQPKSWLGAASVTVLAILGIAYIATRGHDLRQLSVSETIAADTTYNHQVPTVLEHVNTVWSLAFSPDSQILASCGNDRTIKLWDLKTGELIRTIPDAHAGAIWSVAIDPGGDKLISGSSDRTIKVWNLNTGVLLRTLAGHTETVRALAISPNGYTIVSGGADNLVRVWNLNTGQLLSTLQGHTSRIIAIAMSPDGNIVASGGNDNTIRLWNLQTGDLLHTLTGHSDHINSLAFRSDGEVLISGAEDHLIKLWNPRSGDLLHTLNKHDEDVYAIAVSPDGKTLASADKAGEIKLGQ
mgnify:FL=1